MKIGIDGTPLAIPFPCGTKHYAQKLLEGLSKLDKENQYIIFVPKRVTLKLSPNFKYVTIPSLLPVLKRQFFLAYLAKKSRIDVFHYLEPYGAYFFKHPKIVTTVHDFDLEKTYPLASRYFHKRIYCEIVRFGVIKNSNVIITDSNSVSKEVAKFLGAINKRAKIHTIPLAFDPLFKASKNLYQKQKYLLCMGDFAPRKNLTNVFKAYSFLPQDLKTSYPLKVIVSTSSSASRLAEKAKSLKISPFVKFAVNIPLYKLVGLYQKANLFLYPSLYEGFGIPILEAMACGCPVITSNIGCMKELALDSALCITPSSPKSISWSIETIIKDPALATSLIKKGLLRAKLFSWEKTANNTLEVYKTLYYG